MKMTKRAICLLLAAVMALALTIPALAMDEPDADGTKTITLDPGKEGTFPGKNKGDVYTVTLTEAGTLPDILPNPTREGWSFVGWYTEAPTEGEMEKVTSDEGYYYYKEVYRANGDEVEAGSTVTSGSTLYAYYKYQTVKLKLNANGWKNSFSALECTRRADREITKDDLIVVNMTHDSAGNVADWNGTVFDGWWTTEKSSSGGIEIKPENHITFGQLNKMGVDTLYAHWHNTAMGVTQDDATPNYDVTKPTGNLMFSQNIRMENWVHCGETLELTVRRGNNGSLTGIEWTIEDESVVELVSQRADGSGITVRGLGTDNTDVHRTKITATVGAQSVSVYVNVGHKIGEKTVVQRPNCNTRGQVTGTCELCHAFVRIYLPTADHNYITSIIPATCTTDGYTLKVCSLCKAQEKTDIVPAKGHQYVKTTTVGCTGTVTTEKCLACGDLVVTEQTGEGAQAHQWETVYTVDKDASCFSDGRKSIHCAKCPAVKDIQAIPAIDEHSYGPWKTVIEAHWNQEGLEERICSVCGAKQTEVIPVDDNIPGNNPPSTGGGGGGGSSATPSPSPSASPEPSPSESPSPSPEPGTSPEPGVTPKPSPVPVPVDPPKTNEGSGWSYDYDTGDYYYFVEGEPKANYWAKDENASQWGFWYYVGSDGKLATGLQYIENNNGTGWYFLQPGNADGCVGKMLTGWQWLGPEAGEGWFNTAHGGVNGQCTWTENWGDYDPATGLWEDGLSHK